MTIGQKKLLPHDGALAKLADQDPDIAKAIKIYGTPPDRSLPATFENARAIRDRPTNFAECRALDMDADEGSRSSSASVIVKNLMS